MNFHKALKLFPKLRITTVNGLEIGIFGRSSVEADVAEQLRTTKKIILSPYET